MPTARVPIVLVVDDEPAVRAVLTTFLREEGYHVLEAPDGLGAMHLVEWASRTEPRPDVMLLDMMMPGLDGLGVLAQLQQLLGTIPVVAMSASRAHLAAAEAAGAAATVAKPFDFDEVLAVVQRHGSRPS